MFTTCWKLGMMDFDSVRGIRRQVFMEELGYPQEDAFDWFDGIAAHLLVSTREAGPVACARLYPDSQQLRADHFAVLPPFRRQHYADLMLRLVLSKGQQLQSQGILVAAAPAYVSYCAGFGLKPTGVRLPHDMMELLVLPEAIRRTSHCHDRVSKTNP